MKKNLIAEEADRSHVRSATICLSRVSEVPGSARAVVEFFKAQDAF
jgi:hypothetical protein